MFQFNSCFMAFFPGPLCDKVSKHHLYGLCRGYINQLLCVVSKAWVWAAWDCDWSIFMCEMNENCSILHTGPNLFSLHYFILHHVRLTHGHNHIAKPLLVRELGLKTGEGGFWVWALRQNCSITTDKGFKAINFYPRPLILRQTWCRSWINVQNNIHPQPLDGSIPWPWITV